VQPERVAGLAFGLPEQWAEGVPLDFYDAKGASTWPARAWNSFRRPIPTIPDGALRTLGGQR
jgi:hypothetical protein